LGFLGSFEKFVELPEKYIYVKYMILKVIFNNIVIKRTEIFCKLFVKTESKTNKKPFPANCRHHTFFFQITKTILSL